MGSLAVLIGDNRVQVYVLHASENILFHLRIGLLKLCNQPFHLLPLGACVCGIAGSAGVGEFAGALYKVQPVIVPPVLYILLPDKIKGADKLHSFKISAVQLGHHCLHLPAVKHTH